MPVYPEHWVHSPEFVLLSAATPPVPRRRARLPFGIATALVLPTLANPAGLPGGRDSSERFPQRAEFCILNFWGGDTMEEAGCPGGGISLPTTPDPAGRVPWVLLLLGEASTSLNGCEILSW